MTKQFSCLNILNKCGIRTDMPEQIEYIQIKREFLKLLDGWQTSSFRHIKR